MSNKKTTSLIFYGLWALLFIFLLLQYRAVFMHNDDFGYASLSFWYDGNTNGMEWGLKDLFTYLKWHYLNHGGRCLFFFFFCLTLKLGEGFIQVFQPCVVIGITAALYQLFKRHKTDFVALGMAFSVINIIGFLTARDAIYWYCSSSLYIWSFLPLLWGLYFYLKDLSGVGEKILTCVLFFIAGFSHEQIALIVTSFALFSFIYDLINRKVTIAKSCVYLSGILGAACEILAPGNVAVSGEDTFTWFYEMSAVQRVKYGFLNMASLIYNPENVRLIFYTVLILALIGLWLFKKKSFLMMGLNIILGLALLSAAFIPGFDSTRKIIFLVFMIVSNLEIAVCLVKSKATLLLGVQIGGIFSVLFMLLVPPAFLTYRVVAIYIFVTNFLLSYCFMHINSNNDTVIYKIIFGVILVLTLSNTLFITRGYYANKVVNEQNRKTLSEYAGGDTIDLLELPDVRFTHAMPYECDPEIEQLSKWIKNCYEIPQEVQFIWHENSANRFEVDYLSRLLDSLYTRLWTRLMYA